MVNELKGRESENKVEQKTRKAKEKFREQRIAILALNEIGIFT